MAQNDGIMMGFLNLAAPLPTFLARKAKENPEVAKKVVNAAVPQTILTKQAVTSLVNNPKETAKTALKLASPAAGILSVFLG